MSSSYVVEDLGAIWWVIWQRLWLGDGASEFATGETIRQWRQSQGSDIFHVGPQPLLYQNTHQMIDPRTFTSYVDLSSSLHNRQIHFRTDAYSTLSFQLKHGIMTFDLCGGVAFNLTSREETCSPCKNSTTPSKNTIPKWKVLYSLDQTPQLLFISSPEFVQHLFESSDYSRAAFINTSSCQRGNPQRNGRLTPLN